MRILKKLIALSVIGAAFASNVSFAQVSCNGTTACQGPATELIRSLFAAQSASGPIVLINSPTAVAELPCTGANGGANILLAGTHQAFKETYATLLTASVAEKDVILRIDSSQAACTLFFASMLN